MLSSRGAEPPAFHSSKVRKCVAKVDVPWGMPYSRSMIGLHPIMASRVMLREEEMRSMCERQCEFCLGLKGGSQDDDGDLTEVSLLVMHRRMARKDEGDQNVTPVRRQAHRAGFRTVALAGAVAVGMAEASPTYRNFLDSIFTVLVELVRALTPG